MLGSRVRIGQFLLQMLIILPGTRSRRRKREKRKTRRVYCPCPRSKRGKRI